MNSKTFPIKVKDSILVIPPEIQDYVTKYQENIKVSIIVESFSADSDDLRKKWTTWFDEVEEIELSLPNNENDDYGKLLVEKYKKQGLIL